MNPSSSASPIRNRDVFVVKRKVTSTFFTINNGYDGKKPSIMAFVKKQDAQRFKQTIIDMQDKVRPHQKLVIEAIPSSFLWQTCSVGGLDILLNKPGGHSTLLKTNADISDIVFHFENAYLYY